MSCLELAAIIAETLQRAGLTAVLSGGAAVSIYSDDRYQSSNMDFVTSERIADLVAALAPLGFVKGSNRHLTHPNSDYYVEFPPGPVAIGSSVITEWDQLETEFGTIQILSPTQMVMDRLAAYIHWNDPPSLDQAVLIAQNHPLDWKALETWCAGEGGLEKYQAFRRAFGKAERAATETESADS